MILRIWHLSTQHPVAPWLNSDLSLGEPLSSPIEPSLRYLPVRFTVSSNCDAAVNHNQGCGTRFAKANSYGAGFNSAGGGWFAMERSREDGVKVWFWSRHEDDVPRNIRDADTFIDPSSLGMPSAAFPKDTCDYDSHFNAHKMIFDMTLCVSASSILIDSG